MAIHRRIRQKPPVSAEIDWSHPLARGLIRCWLFNEKSGTKLYDLAQRRSANFVNGGSAGLWIPSLTGRAIEANGTITYANAVVPSGLSASFTFVTLATFDNFPTSFPACVMVSEQATNYWAQFGSSGVTGVAQFALFDGTNNPKAQVSGLSTGQWYHMVGIRNVPADTIEIYVDGLSGSATDTTTSVPTYSQFNIGRQISINRPHDGLIDFAYIYDRPLGKQEREWLYRDPFAFISERRVIGFVPAAGGATQDLTPSLFQGADTFFSPTVFGELNLSPALFQGTDAFFDPSVSPGAVDISPALFQGTDTFLSPTVAPVYNISPSLYADDSAFFGPTIASGAVGIFPNLFNGEDTFFTPIVAGGSVDVQPSLFTTGVEFFSPSLQSLYDIAPTLFEGDDLFFIHIISAPYGLSPSLYADDSEFYSPVVQMALTELMPALFLDNDVFFRPIVALASGSPGTGGLLERRRRRGGRR